MNREIKQKWVQALRSGDYKQGGDNLYNPETDAFCCLGVLADLYINEQNNGRGSISDGTFLPGKVCQWAGLIYLDQPVVDPHVDTGWETTSLSRCNDTLELSFNQIADLIEEQL